MQIFYDILAFLKSLSAIDYILYFAVLVLIVLVVSLIYVMKTSDYEEEMEIEKEDFDLQNIVNTIDENPEPAIDMTAYELEQEEKAIISYDELIKTSKMKPIHYEEEEMIDDEVKVKKINLEQLTNSVSTSNDTKVEVQLFRYEREEAFLKTLKQLNELLN